MNHLSKQERQDQELFYRAMVECGTRRAYGDRTENMCFRTLQDEIQLAVEVSIKWGEMWHLPNISRFIREKVQKMPAIPISEVPVGAVFWVRSDKGNPDSMNKTWRLLAKSDCNMRAIDRPANWNSNYMHVDDTTLEVVNGDLQYLTFRRNAGDSRIRFVPESCYRSPMREEPPSDKAVVHIVDVPVDYLIPDASEGVVENPIVKVA